MSTTQESSAPLHPATYQLGDREGLPGHPGYGRHAPVIPVRVMETLYGVIAHVKEIEGHKTTNNLINNAIAEYLERRGHLGSVASGATQNLSPVLAPCAGSNPAGPLPSAGPDLWKPLERELRAAVSDQNFEHFLSGVSFQKLSGETVVLEVPNEWFVGYLGEHYTPVIAEVLLSKHKKPYAVEFVPRPPQAEPCAPASPQEQPASLQEATPPEAAQVLPEPQTIEEFDTQIAAENIAIWKEREKELDRIAYYSKGSHAYMTGQKKAVEGRWAEEDKQRSIEQRRRRIAFLARLAPALLREPPRHIDHVSENPGSAFHSATHSTSESSLRELRSDEKRRPKPDTS